jgi:hypothetical protein
MCDEFFFLLFTALTFPLVVNLISSRTVYGKMMLDVGGDVELTILPIQQKKEVERTVLTG